jgi:hypothetical protein
MAREVGYRIAMPALSKDYKRATRQMPVDELVRLIELTRAPERDADGAGAIELPS